MMIHSMLAAASLGLFIYLSNGLGSTDAISI